MSIFTDVEAFDDNYLRLDADTRYPQRCKFFRYSQLEDVTNFPNLAVIQECLAIRFLNLYRAMENL